MTQEKGNTTLVIFDLDGTLLNTIGDLAASCDAVLKTYGLPLHSFEDYCSFVGNGILRLVERALPEQKRTPEFVAEVRRDFVAYYTEHIDCHTQPYPGVKSLLEELTRRGVKVAVASNKFQAGCEKLIRIFFPEIPFSGVLGQRPNVALKPDPQIVYDLLEMTHQAKENVLYVGDSGVDMQTAKAAGVRSVGCTWGFRTKEELQKEGAMYLVDSTEEILSLL